jgi:hypothetical protein
MIAVVLRPNLCTEFRRKNRLSLQRVQQHGKCYPALELNCQRERGAVLPVPSRSDSGASRGRIETWQPHAPVYSPRSVRLHVAFANLVIQHRIP